MGENNKRILGYIIFVILWLTFASLIVMWILDGGGFEAWIVLIGELAIPLAIWEIAKTASGTEPTELEKNIRRTLRRLQGRLNEEAGIRNFVPLHINQNAAQHQIETIEDAFAQLDHFVIVGKAGTGKTTLLRWLALQETRSSLTDDPLQRVPIWLNLSEWENGQTLAAFIRKQWIDIEKPLENIKQRNGIVFLDGLDELGSESRKKTQQLNKWLHGSSPPYKVVATCRTHNFPSLDVNMPTVSIADELTEAQIYEFADAHLAREAAEQFLSLLMLEMPSRFEKPLADRLQALARQYTAEKDIKLFLKVITEQRHRDSDKWSYFENLYQPFTKTPFQLTALLRHFQKCVDQGDLPLNLGRVTDSIIRAIWSREQARRIKAWIPYEAMTCILANFSYSRMSHSYENDCQTKEGFRLTQASSIFSRSLDRLAHIQRNKYQSGLSIGLKLILLPIWLPVMLLNMLLKEFAVQLVIRFRLRSIEHILEKSRYRKIDAYHKASIRQAQPLLDILVSTGILQVVEEASPYGQSSQPCVHFTDVRLLEYFAAHSFMGIDPKPLFTEGSFGRYQADWRRMSSRWDRVFIALSGLVENQSEFLSELTSIRKDGKDGRYKYDKGKPNDLYLGAKCLLTLGLNSMDTAFNNKLADCLVATMRDVQNAGEMRSVDYAQAIYFLGCFGDASRITATIEALQPYHFLQEALKEIIILYGKDSLYQKPVVDFLLEELEDRIRDKDEDFANQKTAQYIVRTLGQIGAQQARQPLENILILEEIGPEDEFLYGPLLVALVHLGSEKARSKFEEYLIPQRFVRPMVNKQRWIYARDLDASFVPQLIDILYQFDNPAELFTPVVSSYGSTAVPILLKELEQSKDPTHPYFDADILPHVQATLINTLGHIGGEEASKTILLFLTDSDVNPAVCKAVINVATEFPTAFDTAYLYPLLEHKSPVIRSLAAGALGKTGDERAARPLADHLNDNEKVHRQYGYSIAEAVCEFAADALLTINTPETKAIALDWYKNRLLNASENSHEAEHAHLGLVKIATNEAWKIINQWESSI